MMNFNAFVVVTQIIIFNTFTISTVKISAFFFTSRRLIVIRLLLLSLKAMYLAS